MHLGQQAQHHFREGLRLQGSDPAASIDNLRQAVFLDPLHAMAHFTLGNLLLHLGDAAEGLRHVRIAAHCEPENDVFQGRLTQLGELAPVASGVGSATLRDESTDLVTRYGTLLAQERLLDAATLGDWIDVEYTAESLGAQGEDVRVLCAMAHLVAARRRTRLALPVLPSGEGREQAARLAVECADAVGDLRRLLAPEAPDPITEANRLSRLGDSRHESPADAIACYDAALRQSPDHAPAHFGLFVVKRGLGDTADAAYHIYMALQYAPGNAIFRYYYEAWRQADPVVAKLLPDLNAALEAQRPNAARRVVKPLRRANRASLTPPTADLLLPLFDLDDPLQTREYFELLLQRRQHDTVLAYAFQILGRMNARSETQSLTPRQRTSAYTVAHVTGLAHTELALGFLHDARTHVLTTRPQARTRLTTIELAIERLIAV